MLKADVQQDYKNDWIKRCLNLKNADYSLLSQKRLCWFFNNTNASDVMRQIFDCISDKCKGFSVTLGLPESFSDLILCWDLSCSPLSQEQLSEIDCLENDILLVTDKTEFSSVTANLLSQKVITLYCGNIYGAGFNNTEPTEKNCTNILDFFAAQVYLIAGFNNVSNGAYYAGHGECTEINAIKLQDTGYLPMISYDDGKYMTQFAQMRPDELFYFNNTYDGSLKLLHQLLFKCLIEFDRICKKYEIKYFLGGGTLLGAIRHGGMIPWDDDMDVMMLREDYEKFLSVVKKELSSDMFFQSSKTDNEYHSVFTKIRLNGTSFVTRYSQQFENMHQGIFIDIFVHDHTSNCKLGQKIHVFKTLLARSMVFHKWAETPMHFYGRLKPLCKFATKFINKSSMDKLENIQDRVIQKYNGKNTRYLYDGTGEHLRHGAFPAEWLDETEYVEFNGYMFPVPKRYNEYLKYSYGNYNEWIPASLRKAGHDIIKVDFGKYRINKN